MVTLSDKYSGASDGTCLLLRSDEKDEVAIPLFPGMFPMDLSVDDSNAIASFIVESLTATELPADVRDAMCATATGAAVDLLQGIVSRIDAQAAIVGFDIDANQRPLVFVVIPVLFSSKDALRDEWSDAREAASESSDTPIFQAWVESDRTIGRWVWFPDRAHIDLDTGLQADVQCRAMFLVDISPGDVQLGLFAAAVGTGAGSLVNMWSVLAEQSLCMSLIEAPEV